MKSVSKIIALAVLALVLLSAFAGCSSDEITLYNAIQKTGKIKSMDSQTDVAFLFSAWGFPEDQQKQLNEIATYINSLKLSMDQKVVKDDNNAVAKS